MAERGLRFEFEWRITAFTVILLPLFIGLGFWQLQRAQEKQALGALFEARQQAQPAALPALADAPAQELAYRPVQLAGQFDPRYFLLDNRMQGGRYGNEVVQLFHLAAGGSALVNRGWVAADPARRQLPDVATPAGELSLSGQVYVPPGEPYLLGEQQLGADWPKRIQALQMDVLGAELADVDGLFPYSVRIDAGEPGALAVAWPVVNVSPAKHRGYALQWFTMAAALAIIYLLRSSNLWQLLRGGKDKTSD